MAKHSQSTTDKQSNANTPPLSGRPHKGSARVTLWQALLMPLSAVVIFFLLLEVGLSLFGVKPVLKMEDPFVGFASNVPLFVSAAGPENRGILSTAPNKLNFFNQQSFSQQKTPGTYRIFSLGGSTTYGRPYDDVTSFSGWLRELLPAADRAKNWEVINAGGISYASYRVAHLMEELIQYQPDLFIIYTGHNEFLEERTYGQIRDMSPLLRTTVSLFSRTRTWSAMTTGLQKLGIHPKAENKTREYLASEVDMILDRSAGLERYTRDDALQKNILHHFRISLERMVKLARSSGAEVIFVTPASQLKDCTPFKSEHTPGLDPETISLTEQMLSQAKTAILKENWEAALDLLEKAAEKDPRHAEVQYRLGQTLLALGRFDSAQKALRLARDEDVCPLRALTPMQQIVKEVAGEQGVGLVDFVALLEQRMMEIKGYPIPGEEFFLDHVHPTIEGHKMLALALIRAMTDQGLLEPGADFDEKAIAAVANKIEGRIDNQVHGQALASLARVLFWAGKTEDADRLAQQALETAGEYRQVAVDATSILTSVYQRRGNPQKALQLLYSTLEKAPGAIELHLKLGQALLDSRFLNLEEAAANFLLVCQQMPYYDLAHQLYGLAMARRGRHRIAYDSLMEALRLNPNNANARAILNSISPLFKGVPPRPQTPNILLDIYPSLAPHKLVQVSWHPSGRMIANGIEVEFYENGRLKRFADMDFGVLNGKEIEWDAKGMLLSQKVYKQGVPEKGGSVK